MANSKDSAVLGITMTGHDSGAALIANNKVYAISEERLCRHKHCAEFPIKSIEYCVSTAGINYSDIGLIVIDQAGFSRNEKNLPEKFRKLAPKEPSNKRILLINHHDAHAASAFFCSPFKDATILVCDGKGEKFDHFGVATTETESIYFGRDNMIVTLKKNSHFTKIKSFTNTAGIGKFYQMITRYINLGNYNEGKTMGLASYGNDKVFEEHSIEDFMKITEEGLPYCNNRFEFKSFNLKTLFERLINRYKNRKVPFSPLKLGAIRDLKNKLPDDHYTNYAYLAQKVLEKFISVIVEFTYSYHLSENICFSGGVALNIDANSNILAKSKFKNFWIQPASSDAGIPLGCALYGYHIFLGRPRFFEMRNAYLGRNYREAEIMEAIKEYGVKASKSSDVAKETAKLISKGKIIGWFEGGSEFGPRALGHRSIVCDARIENMKDILNEKVKHRENWRPFATSILKEKLQDWFDLKFESSFMLLCGKALRGEKVPSVVHVDGTTRIQTVTKENNGKYHSLIEEFYKLTGVPLVLNTSFNLAGEPIVETPKDALKTFLSTKMDYLILEDFIITK